MAVATYLADKSAVARVHLPPVGARLLPLIQSGLVGTCGIVECEVRFSARSHEEYEAVAAERRDGFEWLPMPDEVWSRTLELQRALSARGRLRSVRFPDLLIAATAERHGVTLLHYDRDFDALAEVSDLRAEWVVPAGTVP
ncbi:MAG TPA: PIN domain nuclease [Acidimicrobiales bacterium]|nr:PIN domain nuclease [Acidimicrobiales bacterium]